MVGSADFQNDEVEDPFDDYHVVRSINDDYSIWPAVKPIPNGWAVVGVTGAKNQCLDWIEANWSGPKIC